jgi:hypothetical protein
LRIRRLKASRYPWRTPTKLIKSSGKKKNFYRRRLLNSLLKKRKESIGFISSFRSNVRPKKSWLDRKSRPRRKRKKE